jgi:hypothetical protein
MFPTYDIWTPSWTFEIHPGTGGANAVFNGTVQHAREQMIEAYPGWDKEFVAWAENQHKQNSTVSTASPASTTFTKRGDQPGTKDDWWPAVCGGFSAGQWDAATDGVAYLKNHGGQWSVEAGPRVCGRISCSYDTAIFVCNDVSL